ncbi:MAG: hypothetical protein QXU61_05995 [Archaeoglobaceae archaeon]
MDCTFCGKKAPSKFLSLCVECAKSERAFEIAEKLHPRRGGFVKTCKLCANECREIALAESHFMAISHITRIHFLQTAATHGFAKGAI